MDERCKMIDRESIVQDRIAGMAYSQIAERHGVNVALCRHACKRAMKIGRVTAKQIGYKALKVKRAHAAPYHGLYEKLVKRINIDEATGCWNWTGPGWFNRPHPGNRYGYVMVWDGKKYKTIGAHRAMMIAKHGPLTPDQCACHKCDNVLCINPDHLYVGSMKENIWDSKNRGRHYESKLDHCHRGHPLFGDNVRICKQHPPKTGIRRACKACEIGRMRVLAGWPEVLAYTLPSLPFGREIDKSTGQLATHKAYRRKQKRVAHSADDHHG